MAELAAVVFDLDDTLFDHYGSATQALETWFPALGGACTPELVEAWFEAEQRHFPAWRDGLIAFDEQRRRRMRDMLVLLDLPPRSGAGLDALFADYLAAYQRTWRGFDDVGGALDAVADAGLRTAILTNGPDELQNAKLAAIGLARRVGPVVTAEGLGIGKPNLEAYARLCAALGLEPASVLYVGDDYELDVVAARSAGLRAVHLDRRGTGPHHESARIETLRDLSAYIV